MAQFAVYENKNPTTKDTYPFLVDVQSDLLADLKTTVVIPLSPLSAMAGKPISHLCPVVGIRDKEYVVLTQQLAGVNRKILGRQVAELSNHRSDFIAAIDFLISGI